MGRIKWFGTCAGDCFSVKFLYGVLERGIHHYKDDLESLTTLRSFFFFLGGAVGKDFDSGPDLTKSIS